MRRFCKCSTQWWFLEGRDLGNCFAAGLYLEQRFLAGFFEPR